MAIGKSFNLKKQKMTKESTRTYFWANAEAQKEFHLSSSYWTEKFNLHAARRIILVFQSCSIERNSSEKKYTMRKEDWRKAKNIWGKNKSNCIDIARKDGILYFMTTLRTNSFLWKISRKCVTSCISRLAAQRILLQFRESTRFSQVWTWEEKSMNSECGSVHRNFEESRVTYGSEDSGGLWETHASGNREVWIKKSLSQAMLIPEAKSGNGNRMKGSHKKAHKKQVKKVHFAALEDIRHIHKYEYIPENVRKSNLKCGKIPLKLKFHCVITYIFQFFVHSMSFNIDMNISIPQKKIWIYSSRSQTCLDFPENIKRRESWETPHSNPIRSPSISRQICVLVWLLEYTDLVSLHFSFASEGLCIFSRHKTESERTCTLAFAHQITWSCTGSFSSTDRTHTSQ